MQFIAAMKRAFIVALSISLLASACGSSVNTPDIKQNPHPKMRYEITLTIQDAPGPFESITGFMQYDVTNEQCAPFNEFIGIYRTPPEQGPPITFAPVGANEYKGTIYLDLLQDEDYYGLGVCHWSMTAAVAQLRIGEVTLGSGLMQKEIINQQSITRYFPKQVYGDNSIKDMSYSGAVMSSFVANRQDEFFSVNLTAKEHFE